MFVMCSPSFVAIGGAIALGLLLAVVIGVAAGYYLWSVQNHTFLHHKDIQWNLSNPDTIGPEESVLIREVSLFQRLKCHEH